MIELPAPAWCISIPRLSERREVFRKHWGDSVQFHEGVDYWVYNVHGLLREHGKVPMFVNYPLPWLAIYLSHLTLWQRLLAGPECAWVIFEDDAGSNGLPFCDPVGELFRYYSGTPPNARWVGTACYYATRPMLQRLVACQVACSPDRLLKAVENDQPRFADPSPIILTAPRASYVL